MDMSEFCEKNLRNRFYLDNRTDIEIVRFKDEPEIDCYKSSGERWHVKFKIGAIIHNTNGADERYDIVYAERASDGCVAFGPQSKNKKDYIFEYNGTKYPTVYELFQHLNSKNDLLYNVESDDFDDI